MIFRSYKKRDVTVNPQYEILAECLLPNHMLEWFELTNVEVKPKENTVTQDTQSEEGPVNVIHLYLDENNLTPDNREDLRPNGFTTAKTFHDFPIRGQEVLRMCAAVTGLTPTITMSCQSLTSYRNPPAVQRNWRIF